MGTMSLTVYASEETELGTGGYTIEGIANLILAM